MSNDVLKVQMSWVMSDFEQNGTSKTNKQNPTDLVLIHKYLTFYLKEISKLTDN
jgi:hypothetical protein